MYSDSSDEGGNELEELYYEAKASKSDEGGRVARDAFRNVVKSDVSKTEWGLRSLKQLMKLAIAEGNQEHVQQQFYELLDFILRSSTLPVAAVDKAVKGLLERVKDARLQEVLCKGTIEQLDGTKYTQLTAKIHLKLAELYLAAGAADRLDDVRRIADDLHAKYKVLIGDELGMPCIPGRQDDLVDDPTKASQLWEVYALKMRLARRLRDYTQLLSLFEAVTKLEANVNHLRTVAIVQECGALGLFENSQFEDACVALAGAFRQYNQANSSDRLLSLCHAVLIEGASGRTIDNFIRRVDGSLVNDALVGAARQLVAGYNAQGLHGAIDVYSVIDVRLHDDDFVKEFMRFARRRHIFARVPMDIWVDAFRPLPRPELDAAQFSNSAFAHAMQSPAVPAREVECISIQPLWNHNEPAIDPRKVMEQHMMETRAHHALYRLRQLQQQQRGDQEVGPSVMEALLGHPVPEPVPEQAVEEAVREFYMQAHAPMLRDIEHEHTTDDDAQERIDQTVAEGPPPADYVLSFSGTKQQEDRQPEGAGASPALRRGTLEALAAIVNQVARNTYIHRFSLCGPLSDGFLQAFGVEFYDTVRVKSLAYTNYYWDGLAHEAHILQQFYLNLRHRPALLCSTDCMADQSFASNGFLHECITRGITIVRFPLRKPFRSGPRFALTEDAIMDFGFGPGDRGGLRTLMTGPCHITPQFIGRVIQVGSCFCLLF
ncbi:MYC1 protein [Aphelenchoides avenae]|nr:MYC1 protein [Aphelenchus avenae]